MFTTPIISGRMAGSPPGSPPLSPRPEPVNMSWKTHTSSSSSAKMSSPLSPTKISRVMEKKELASLNDRLAGYIDKVRFLEGEKRRLEAVASSVEETTVREVTTVKTHYEQELGLARKALDDMAKEKAKWEVETQKSRREVKEIGAKNRDLERRLREMVEKLGELEEEADRLRRGDLLGREMVKKKDEEIRTLRENLSLLKGLYDEEKEKAEKEKLERMELENQMRRISEERAFEKELLETKMKESLVTICRDISPEDLQDTYQERLETSLQQLRDDYQAQMEELKESFSNVYEPKIDQLEVELKREGLEGGKMRVELDERRTLVRDLETKVREAYEQVRRLKEELELERVRGSEMEKKLRRELEVRANELERLKAALKKQALEFKELMEIKVGLDMEISAYQKMIEGEEDRLGLVGSSRRTKARGTKRKMVEFTGKILIEGVGDGASQVKLTNDGDEEIPLGGCTLQYERQGPQGRMVVNYRFHWNVRVSPRSSIVVCSAGLGIEHDPAKGNFVTRGEGWRLAGGGVVRLLTRGGAKLVEIIVPNAC